MYRINSRFTYHPPVGDDVQAYEKIRALGKNIAIELQHRCPDSTELAHAINHIDQAVMWANAAIARNPR
jgi:hypothetical protein